jgi:hypothetical protein
MRERSAHQAARGSRAPVIGIFLKQAEKRKQTESLNIFATNSEWGWKNQRPIEFVGQATERMRSGKGYL